MFNLTFRTPQRPARREPTEQHRPERPLPRLFARKLECDLKHNDKLARVLVGRRPE